MNEKPKIIPENYNLFHINIVESSIVSTPDNQNINYTIDVGHTVMHDIETKRVKIGILTNIKGIKDNEKVNAKAFFNIDFHFEVYDLEKFYKDSGKGNIVFDGTFIAVLLGISYSTARGLIYERLNDTSLEGVILPIVSPQKLLQDKKEAKSHN